jgi:hypothetical protein
MLSENPVKRDVGSIVCTLLLILLAGLFYFDTTTMVDSDSYVFPRAVILILLIIGSIRLLQDFIAPMKIVRSVIDRNYIRGFIFVVVMGVAISLIPYVGFLTAMFMAFFIIMFTSMYESWTKSKLFYYVIIAAVVVTVLYLIFEKIFMVQFPESKLF